MAATLINKYVNRTGSTILTDLLSAKIEQAMVAKAVEITREANPSAARLAFAQLALTSPASAFAIVEPYVTNNPVISDAAAEPSDGDIEYATQTQAIDALYPPTVTP